MSDAVREPADKSQVDGAAARKSIMQAVNFEVEAIIGSATMTLKTLESLESGGIIPLSANLNDVVSLRLNGVEIARGELVSVDDKFAVKITEVAD